MSDIALSNATAYAAKHHPRLAVRLGYGIHGTVHVAEHEGKWESQKREQFGPRWATVRRVMDALEAMGIYLLDVSPSNIAFAE